jgi:hypothetical protein
LPTFTRYAVFDWLIQSVSTDRLWGLTYKRHLVPVRDLPLITTVSLLTSFDLFDLRSYRGGDDALKEYPSPCSMVVNHFCFSWVYRQRPVYFLYLSKLFESPWPTL